MGLHLLEASLAIYAVASILYLVFVATLKERVVVWARGLLVGSWLVHTVAIAYWMGDLGPQRLTHVYALLPLFGWLLVTGYLFLDWRIRLRVLGAFVAPAICLSLLLCIVAHPEVRPVGRAVKGALLPVHISLAFVGTAALALACSVAILYLLQESQLKRKRFGRFFHRVPSLETLDRINYRCVTIGFPLYTAGLVLGGLWATRITGDPQVQRQWVLALLAWVFFGLLLQARLLAGWRGRRAAVLTIAGFCAVLGVLAEYMARGAVP